jgi:hypothetical protein
LPVATGSSVRVQVLWNAWLANEGAADAGKTPSETNNDTAIRQAESRRSIPCPFHTRLSIRNYRIAPCPHVKETLTAIDRFTTVKQLV